MNRRFRASEMTLGEVYENLAPHRPHVDNFQSSAAASAADGSVGDSSHRLAQPSSPGGIASESQPHGRGDRAKDSSCATDAPPGVELQRQAHDAIHSYLSHVAGYDHDLAQPAYYKVASTLEAIAQPLGRKVRAQQDNAR